MSCRRCLDQIVGAVCCLDFLLNADQVRVVREQGGRVMVGHLYLSQTRVVAGVVGNEGGDDVIFEALNVNQRLSGNGADEPATCTCWSRKSPVLTRIGPDLMAGGVLIFIPNWETAQSSADGLATVNFQIPPRNSFWVARLRRGRRCCRA